MDEFTDRFAALAQLWNRIEPRVKEYEHFAGAANISAINELRYAGRRLIDALQIATTAGGDAAKVADHLVVAEAYLVNADHDVTDGVCFIVMKHVDKVIRRHGREAIAEHVPDFWEVYPLVLKAQKITQCSRGERQNRKDDYRTLANEYLPKLTALYNDLIRIKALHVPDDREELHSLRVRVRLITFITIIGSIFSTLAFFLGILAWAYPTGFWQMLWSIF